MFRFPALDVSAVQTYAKLLNTKPNVFVFLFPFGLNRDIHDDFFLRTERHVVLNTELSHRGFMSYTFHMTLYIRK